MSFVSHLRGLGNRQHYSADELMNLCPEDNRPVEMVLDIARLKAERGNDWYSPQRKNLWRFGGLLALDPDNPDDQPHIQSLGEGYTPQLDYCDHPIASKVGLKLEVKDEGKSHPGFGANPTLSFKDRGMVMAVSMAHKFGLKKLVVPTQGNAGDSLAEYGRAAGMEVAVIMPDDTPMPIMGKVAAYARQFDGFSLDIVQGTIREAGALMKERYLPQGYFNMATFQEPGWRIEGKKTLGLELAEPKPGQPNWQLPDAVIYPTGGGTGVLGMWKAFDELEALGMIGSHRPKIFCIQSDVTAPLVQAFESGADDTTPAQAGKTIAYGLNVPGGVGHFKVLEIIRNSGGVALAVDEAQIAEQLQRVWNNKGWWVCPEGAACLAALEPLVEQKLLLKGEHVVVFNTGSFEKYLPQVRDLL